MFEIKFPRDEIKKPDEFAILIYFPNERAFIKFGAIICSSSASP